MSGSSEPRSRLDTIHCGRTQILSCRGWMTLSQSLQRKRTTMVYEFWDMRSHNLIAAFESEQEALEVLRGMIREQGERTLDYLMLIEDDCENDSSRIVGMGLQLADLVKSMASVSYTHLRAHETVLDLVCRLLLE